MAQARNDMKKDVEGVVSQEPVGKRRFQCGSTGAAIWLMRVPKTPADCLALAKELSQTTWGDNHFFHGGRQQYLQVISDLILMANGQNPLKTSQQVTQADAKSQVIASASAQSKAGSASGSTVVATPATSIKKSLSRSTSMHFKPAATNQVSVTQAPGFDEVDFSRLNVGADYGDLPHGLKHAHELSDEHLNGFHRL